MGWRWTRTVVARVVPPPLCRRCGRLLDPVLIREGYRLHPGCEFPKPDPRRLRLVHWAGQYEREG